MAVVTHFFPLGQGAEPDTSPTLQTLDQYGCSKDANYVTDYIPDAGKTQEEGQLSPPSEPDVWFSQSELFPGRIKATIEWYNFDEKTDEFWVIQAGKRGYPAPGDRGWEKIENLPRPNYCGGVFRRTLIDELTPVVGYHTQVFDGIHPNRMYCYAVQAISDDYDDASNSFYSGENCELATWNPLWGEPDIHE